MFRRLLIANRGEIACRVQRTAHRLGVETVAVYSEADADALHVAQADTAVCIGPPPARESYLDVDAVLGAAVSSGADSLHPGYGFLSESPELAEACARAGVAFVGPTPAAIRTLGSKVESKRLMESAGVPVVPGHYGDDPRPEILAEAARAIGYPVLIKASAGGGGRGMRAVERPEDFAEALASARRESLSAFGDDTVLLERYLQRPRHIEVQVFADEHGNAIHLGERDCSTQRRHQKIVEEAPAPGLSPSLRKALGEASVAAAQAARYTGAGTVEFVVEGESFYFLEMNTRLQVEHPVTEAVLGLDLVEWQLRIAAGEPLPLAQADVSPRGHAVEARLYAEDPAQGFVPSSGEITHLRLPESCGPIRVDTGVRTGDRVTPYYDAMLAKLIAWGETREDAIARLRGAVAHTEVLGVATNLGLLGSLLEREEFVAGGVDTAFVDRHPELSGEDRLGAERSSALAALGEVLVRRAARPADASAWQVDDAFRPNQTARECVRLVAAEGEVEVELSEAPGGGGWQARIGDQVLPVEAHLRDGRLQGRVDGAAVDVPLHRGEEGVDLLVDGRLHRHRIARAAGGGTHRAVIGDGVVRAPLPGVIARVFTEEGAWVEADEPLLVLEAMKMEHTLTAPMAGIVRDLSVRAGEPVLEQAALLTVVPEAEAEGDPPSAGA